MGERELCRLLRSLSCGLVPKTEGDAMREAARMIERLVEERDAARRDSCHLNATMMGREPRYFALKWGWDCFLKATQRIPWKKSRR